MKFYGIANDTKLGLSAVMVVGESTDPAPFTISAGGVEGMLQKNDLSPDARQAYSEALEQIHKFKADGAGAELQTIANPGDFVLPSGNKLRDTLVTPPEYRNDGFAPLGSAPKN